MISIIIPFYNEEESLPVLINQLIETNKDLGEKLELILIDDGSTDRSVIRIKDEIVDQGMKNQTEIKVVSQKKRRGKGSALALGLQEAKGEILAFMDADLQDDPRDLGKFLAKIREGYDFVNGIRIGRHQNNSLLEMYSKLAEKLLKLLINSPYSDINCGFKMFKRKVLKNFVFYGNNFRFFPLAVFYNGYRVTETETKNNLRVYGKSKFGITKLFGGIFDTITTYFIFEFAEKPLHFFGIIGGFIFGIGFIISAILTFQRIFFGLLLYRRPALWFALVMIVVGIQIILTGIVGELIVYSNKRKN